MDVKAYFEHQNQLIKETKLAQKQREVAIPDPKVTAFAQKTYQKDYYRANKANILKKKKEYYQKNKESIKEKNSDYYHGDYKFREKISMPLTAQKKAYNAQWRFENPDKVAEYNKSYYQNNKEDITERKKAYREANKDKILEYNRQYYAQHKDKISSRRKEKLLEASK